MQNLTLVPTADEPEEPSGELIEPDDEESIIVDRAVNGDARAFAELYERYVDRVYRHAYFYIGNRADAEDVAQQTFLRAWQAIGRYQRGDAPIIAWLLTIAGRTAISQTRRTRKDPGESASWDEVGGDDPQEIVATLNSCDMVRDAILQLGPDRRQVVVLRFIEGMSIAQVASVLGKSESNVSVIQHRALNDLRRLLADRHTRREPRSRVTRTLRDVFVRATGSA